MTTFKDFIGAFDDPTSINESTDIASLYKSLTPKLKRLGLSEHMSFEDGFVYTGTNKGGDYQSVSVLFDSRKSKNYYIDISFESKDGSIYDSVKSSSTDLASALSSAKTDLGSKLKSSINDANAKQKKLLEEIELLKNYVSGAEQFLKVL